MFNNKNGKHKRGKEKYNIVVIPPSQLEKMMRGQHPGLNGDTYDVSNLVATLAIEFWRLEKRLEKGKESLNEEKEREVNSVFDQIQRIKDVFKRQEIEVKEHTGDKYNDGMSVKALHFEEIDNLPEGEMKIIETIKPSVYFKGTAIFHGEVIVGKANKKSEEGGK